MREVKYSDMLDPKFSKFLESEDKAATLEQFIQMKAGPLVDTDIAKKATLFKFVFVGAYIAIYLSHFIVPFLDLTCLTLLFLVAS